MPPVTVTAEPPAALATVPNQPQQIPYQPTPAFDPNAQPDTMQGGTQGFTVAGGNDDPELHAAAVHHGRLASMLNAVGDILGGNKTLRLTQNPDGSVDATQVDSSRGEKWGRVAQAALRGAATGFAVGQGPGGGARAAAASTMQGLDSRQAQQDKTIADAERANNQNQNRKLFNANMAMLNQRLMKDTFDMQQSKIAVGEHAEDRALNIKSAMDKTGSTMALHVGASDDPSKLMEDVANGYNSTPELQQAHHDGRTLVFQTHDDKGAVTGADIYIVPEDQMDKPYDQDFVRKRLTLDQEHPEKAPVWSTLGTLTKGKNKTRDVMAMMQSDDAYNNQILTQYTQRTGELAQAKINEMNARAEAAQAKANAGGGGGGTMQLVEGPDGKSMVFNSKTGQTGPAPGGVQRVGTADKKAAALEKKVAPIRDATNFANSYLTLGKFSGPKDEALMEKYFDLAKPESGGFRMTQSQQDMLKQSRGWYQGVKASGQHFLNGTWFSDDQRRQIVDAMNDLAAARQTYEQQQAGGVEPPPGPAAVPRAPGTDPSQAAVAPAAPGAPAAFDFTKFPTKAN